MISPFSFKALSNAALFFDPSTSNRAILASNSSVLGSSSVDPEPPPLLPERFPTCAPSPPSGASANLTLLPVRLPFK